MNKRFLSVVSLILCLLAQTSAWAYTPLAASVQRKAAAARRSNQQATTKTQTARQPQANPKTQAPENKWGDLPVISYKAFEKANEETKIINNEFRGYLADLYGDEILTGTFHEGTPDYAALTKGVKYVYIVENGEERTSQEAEKIIRTIVKDNSGKKILLASSFLQIPHPLVNPLMPHDNSFHFSIDANGVNDVAEKLEIDTLALGEEIIQLKDAASMLKVGDTYVCPDIDEPILEDLISLYGDEIKQYALDILSSGKDGMAFQIARSLMSPDVIKKIYKQMCQEPAWAEIKKDISAPEMEPLVAAYIARTLPTPDGFDPVDGIYPGENRTTYLQLFSEVALFTYLNQYVQQSALSRKQLNLKAAQLINKVKDDYDMIIIWCDFGTMSQMSPSSLDMLIGSSDAVAFELNKSPSEQPQASKDIFDDAVYERQLLEDISGFENSGLSGLSEEQRERVAKIEKAYEDIYKKATGTFYLEVDEETLDSKKDKKTLQKMAELIRNVKEPKKQQTEPARFPDMPRKYIDIYFK